MKKLIGMSILLVLGLTGCQNSAEMSASDPDQLLQKMCIRDRPWIRQWCFLGKQWWSRFTDDFLGN